MSSIHSKNAKVVREFIHGKDENSTPVNNSEIHVAESLLPKSPINNFDTNDTSSEEAEYEGRNIITGESNKCPWGIRLDLAKKHSGKIMTKVELVASVHKQIAELSELYGKGLIQDKEFEKYRNQFVFVLAELSYFDDDDHVVYTTGWRKSIKNGLSTVKANARKKEEQRYANSKVTSTNVGFQAIVNKGFK